MAAVTGWVVPVGAAAVLSLGVLSAAACGDPGAADLWGQPDRSGAHDAHATLVATGADAGFQGDGTIVFKPRTAMSLRLRTRNGPLSGQLDVVEVNGVTYQRPTASQKWARSAVPVPDPSWNGVGDQRVVGQDTIGRDRAWHLAADRGGSPLDLWVRVSDGYPLRVVTRSAGGTTYEFAFDHFNTGERVVAPLAYELKPAPRQLAGRVGDVLALNAARIAVLSFEDAAVADDGVTRPLSGNRFVVIEVSVENTSGGLLSTFLDWRLTDGGQASWSEALSIREPPFPAGELAPGESAHGFLTYEIGGTASKLTLVVKLDDDTASFALT